MEAKKEKWTGKRIAKLVVDIVCYIFFAFALVFTIFAFTAQNSSTGVPTIGHKALLTVESPSMKGENGFDEGDLIFVKVLPDVQDEDKAEERAKAISELKVTEYNADGSIKELGDVITFKKDLNYDGVLELNTHRIIGVETDANGHLYFTTKGDNNLSNDNDKVIDNDILGVWTGKKNAGGGKFLHDLQPPQYGFFVFIIVPLAGFLTYEIVLLVLTIKKMKEGDGRKISAAEEELIKQKAIEEYLKKQEAEKASQENSEK